MKAEIIKEKINSLHELPDSKSTSTRSKSKEESKKIRNNNSRQSFRPVDFRSSTTSSTRASHLSKLKRSQSIRSRVKYVFI